MSFYSDDYCSCLQEMLDIHALLFGMVNARVRFLEGRFCESYACNRRTIFSVTLSPESLLASRASCDDWR